MNHAKNKARGLGLCSGGLDSMLSALILRQQQVEVEWISFETPFFSAEKARQAAKMLRVPLTVRNITAPYLNMLVAPPCGYGQHMNPCMDCHTLMFRLAGEWMDENGFDFLFSGEVLGQRPMSQTRPSLRYVEKHSGRSGYILRPLSAQLLDETIPEKNGWVDRTKLLAISGRSRKAQMALAEQWGIRSYPTPAGGCLLTDKGFSERLRDVFAHQGTYRESELHLLRFGRHFRLSEKTRLIVGRTKEENEQLLLYVEPSLDVVLKTQGIPGPTAVLPGFSEDASMLGLAAGICAGYSKAPKDSRVSVGISGAGFSDTIQVLPRSAQEAKTWMIGG
jgi:tRNA U34 2-thiouridine synthase MnmA/TrmU